MSTADERRRDVVLAGYRQDRDTARSGMSDADPRVRAAALGALVRMGQVTGEDIHVAIQDHDAEVRRQACELAPRLGGAGAGAAPAVGDLLLAALDDIDQVAEMAAWALGEIGLRPAATVERLAAMATGHADALCREAAVAALGAIGDPAGKTAVLQATGDKPAVRRRAVIALAAFEGPDVEAALDTARGDRDWQVRAAAEDLLGLPPS